MKRRIGISIGVVVALATIAWMSPEPTMRRGAVDAKSLGQMAFGPNNVLFIGDNDGAQILAVEIADDMKGAGAIDIQGIDAKVAQVLGVTPADVRINDLQVHPVSKNVYLTVTRGTGANASPVLLRVTRNAAKPIEEVSLDNV